jgi:uncharacterized protein YneF (UPF0154 family)
MNELVINLVVIFLALLRVALPILVLLLIGAWLDRRNASRTNI